MIKKNKILDQINGTFVKFLGSFHSEHKMKCNFLFFMPNHFFFQIEVFFPMIYLHSTTTKHIRERLFVIFTYVSTVMAKKDKTTLLVILTESFYPFWQPLYLIEIASQKSSKIKMLQHLLLVR